ncbi:MAG: MFS transporter, partial [Flavobacteriales bacterium]|nr:MFS transporter [Flavobacteriales bacterium]
LWVGMCVMSLAEMLNFPFMNRFAFDRSDQGPPGAYMALFTISWSVASIVGHPMGLNLVDKLGFMATWQGFTGVLLLALALLFVLERMVRREERVRGPGDPGS